MRALRHGLIATAGVLLVCAVVAGLSWRAYAASSAQLRALTARGTGEVVEVGPARSVLVRWRPAPGGPERTDGVALAVSPPPVRTTVEVAYDPGRPERLVIPGATLLADADRAASGLAFSALVAALVLAAGGWQVLSRRAAARRPGRPEAVRRVRLQSGLTARSWLETEAPPRRWMPVHFDPVLVTLPSPSVVELRGNRLVAAAVNGADGVLLYPSGPARRAEPRGRRTDNPSRPDQDAVARAAEAGGWRRQLRADLVLLVPAPLVGLFWVLLDGGGFPTWLFATAITAAVALWWAALRGSDPS